MDWIPNGSERELIEYYPLKSPISVSIINYTFRLGFLEIELSQYCERAKVEEKEILFSPSIKPFCLCEGMDFQIEKKKFPACPDKMGHE